MKIIYATDFSVPAAQARRVAVNLARRFGDSVVVAHAVQIPSVVSPEVLAAEPALLERMKVSVAAQLRTVADTIRHEGLVVEEQVLVGSPYEVVSTLAEASDVRLVVVGTHGRSALGRVFLGSVAERLVRLCKRPVLVVPPDADLSLLEPSPRPLRLTVALDRGPAGEAATALVGQLRTKASADVTFIHLYDSDQEHARLGLPEPFGQSGPDPDVLTLLERDLRPRIGQLPGQGKVDLRLCAVKGPAAEFLRWTAVAQRADLLLVGAPSTPSTALTRSAAVDVVRAATIPVLVAPAPAREATASRGLAPIRSVLAATDLSELGNTAVAEAYRLLRASGGVVELCHVASTGGEPLAPERWAEVQKQLWAIVPARAEDHGIVTRVSVLDGDPAEALLQASERLGADVITVGTHGRTGLARVLGSVADALIRRSPRPVLVVRGRAA